MQAWSREIKPNFFFSTEKKTPSKQGGYYYLFGMTINERSWNADSYDYGFNGQEKDDEVKGSGNSIEFKYRVHDTRLGRFLSVDPLSIDYPWNSPYAFAENKVIWAMELEGLEAYYTNEGDALGQVGESSEVREFELDNSEGALPKEQQIQNLVAMINKANSGDKETSEIAKANLMAASSHAADNILEYDWPGTGKGKPQFNFDGLMKASVGATFTVLAKDFYDVKNGKGYWRGKNDKYYDPSWGGNGSTGSRKYAQKMSKTFTKLGYGLGALNAFSIEQQYRSGEINNAQRWTEQGSNTFSTFLGLHGAAWGLGWELGRTITEIPGYHENIRVPLQRTFNLIPDEQECIVCSELNKNR